MASSHTRHRYSERRALGHITLGLGLTLSLGCSSDTDGGPAQGGSGPTAGASSVAGQTSASGSSGVGGSAGSANGGTSPGGAATGGIAGASSGASGGAALGGGGSGGQSASGGAGGAGGAGGKGGAGGASGGEAKSAGCGKMRTLQDGSHMVQSGGAQRSYRLRAPTNYDKDRPYRLIFGFHGASGKSSDIAPSFFGLWELSEGSTIFVAPDAVGGLWKADSDTAMVTDLLKQLEAELCIDTSRVSLEGFSQGGAMTWTLACALPGKFNVAVVHSGGGLAMPKTCQPIPFLSMLGTDGSGQGMSSDFFAMTNGCTVEALPMAPTGGHACTDYKGCSANHPTRWCDYDAGHLPNPTDSGQSKSWVPAEVWKFVQQF
jgi:hypothetical protein